MLDFRKTPPYPLIVTILIFCDYTALCSSSRIDTSAIYAFSRKRGEEYVTCNQLNPI